MIRSHDLPRRAANGLLSLLFLLGAAPAEEPASPGLDYYLPAAADPDPAAPTPESVLGWRFADWHLRHHELIAYLTALDAWSDRIALAEYARSHGRRPLVVLTITAPRNHRRLEEIRRQHLDRLGAAFDGGTDAPPAGSPLIAWMGYGVHGNEPSATQSAALLAYHLASARDEATLRLLDRTVILLEPCLNPDGMDRFAEWTNSHRGAHPSAHRADREHREGWPSGRSNYYWFDLNRDWLPATQPESQGRLRVFHDWMPQLVTDYHEMGNTNRTYFFQPGVPEMAHPLIPPRNQELTARLAEANGRALDGIGSLYYTRESFDDFYPGKGSTYPDLCGSVGILYEQASSRGYWQETEHGRLTFPFTIRNQLATSLATLRAADAGREELLAHQLEFHREARTRADASPVKAHLVGVAGDAARLAAFRRLLERHRIRVGVPAAPVLAAGRRHAPSRCLVIPTGQPRYHLLTALMERRTEFGGAVFYDVSAWHLPSAFGLEQAELTFVPPLRDEPAAAPPAGRLTGAAEPVAYLIPWEPMTAPTALWALAAREVRVWVARRPLGGGLAGGKGALPAGTLVVPVASQPGTIDPASLRTLLADQARRHGLTIRGVSGGLGQPGGLDLGSPSLSPLRRPRVALLTGPGVASTTAGDLWHQFDRLWEAPLTRLESTQLSPGLLRDFDTLLLADVSYGGLGADARAAVQGWVSAGGTLIAIGSAVPTLAAQDWVKADLAKADFGQLPPGAPYADLEARHAQRQIKGAVVRATYDPTHPLAFGLGSRDRQIALFRTGTTFLAAPADPALAPFRHPDDCLVAGFVARPNLAALAGSVPLRLCPAGSGRVVLLTDNPVFRGHWHGSAKLLANAIFFTPLVTASSGGGGEPGDTGDAGDEDDAG